MKNVSNVETNYLQQHLHNNYKVFSKLWSDAERDVPEYRQDLRLHRAMDGGVSKVFQQQDYDLITIRHHL